MKKTKKSKDAERKWIAITAIATIILILLIALSLKVKTTQTNQEMKEKKTQTKAVTSEIKETTTTNEQTEVNNEIIGMVKTITNMLPVIMVITIGMAILKALFRLRDI